MTDYPIVIFWSDEDHAWLADIPDLQGCTADGETPEEALHEVLIVKRLWLEVAREDGVDLPEPSHRAQGRLLAS